MQRLGSPVIVLENSFRKLDQFDLVLYQESGPTLSLPWINLLLCFFFFFSEMEGNKHIVNFAMWFIGDFSPHIIAVLTRWVSSKWSHDIIPGYPAMW